MAEIKCNKIAYVDPKTTNKVTLTIPEVTEGGDIIIPDATDSTKGGVILSDAIDGSQNAATGKTAATPKAVADAISSVTTTINETVKNEITNIVSGGEVQLVPDATDVIIGKVKLTDNYDQDLSAATGITAVTPNAVKAALQAAKDYTDNHAGTGGGDVGYIVKPVITTPANDATGVSTFATIVATGFKSVFDDDTRTHREFRISETEGFESTVATKDVNADQWTVDVQLPQNKKLYARVRDVASSGFSSSWSDTITFTTAEGIAVTSPTVTLHGYNDSPSDIGSGLRITSSEFSVSGGEDTHRATSWSIALGDGRGKGNVWESLEDTTHKTEITVPEGTLQKSTKYKLTVIYHGNTAYDSAPTVVDFTTSSDFGTVNAPTLEVEGAPSSVGETPTLTGGAFSNTRDPDTHEMTDWEIVPSAGGEAVWQSLNNSSDKTTIKVPKSNLTTGTAYKARVRYKGTKLGWSEWTETSFTTKSVFVYVETPTISIAGGTTDVTPYSLITGSEFKLME